MYFLQRLILSKPLDLRCTPGLRKCFRDTSDPALRRRPCTTSQVTECNKSQLDP